MQKSIQNFLIANIQVARALSPSLKWHRIAKHLSCTVAFKRNLIRHYLYMANIQVALIGLFHFNRFFFSFANNKIALVSCVIYLSLFSFFFSFEWCCLNSCLCRYFLFSFCDSITHMRFEFNIFFILIFFLPFVSISFWILVTLHFRFCFISILFYFGS